MDQKASGFLCVIDSSRNPGKMKSCPCGTSTSQFKRNLLIVFILIVTATTCEGCSGRTVLNSTTGTITDGPGNYPPSAHCEWLIDAGSLNKSITLTFDSMETECSYDYLFIYDGMSYASPLLGSYSGSTIPDSVLATSGYMLIYFYSDRNYVLKGFNAEYTISDCPFDCSSHGICNKTSHRCLCHGGYIGPYCNISMCPGDCGEHGSCDYVAEKCKCDAGYTGRECKLATNSSESQSTWYLLSPEGLGFTARTGHAGTFITKYNSLYVFGGHTLNTILGDLVKYDLTINEWTTVLTNAPTPLARRNHAVELYGDNFYMYGGLLEDGSMSNELWFFDVGASKWILKAGGSVVKPPAVSCHTVTLVEGRWLYLFGGRTATGEFVSDIHRIEIQTAEQWEKVKVRGGKAADSRLIGHSTVYHKQSKSLLVFGGFSPDYARFPRRTNYLHAFHIEKNFWSQVHYDEFNENEPPKDRAFHTATIMDNYMVVYGGNCHKHHEEEICYDNQIHFYHLGCHRWVDHMKLEAAGRGDHSSASHRGRFSHVAALAYGNTLIISGGYRGSVLGDLMAYAVPPGVAKNWDDSQYRLTIDHCNNMTDYDHCKEDPECVWCMQLPERSTAGLEAGCMLRSLAHTCKKELRYGNCPGVCYALHDCASCTVQGQGALVANDRYQDLWHNERCAWCVKEASCQKIGEPQDACNPSSGAKSIVDPWWGKNSSRLQTVDQCRLEDYPAGLHFIKYRHPMDIKHPDAVKIVRKTGLTFQFEPLFDSENIANTVYTAKFQGFIHPMGATSSNGPPLKVFLVSVAADAQLFLSTDVSKDNKDLVAELSKAGYVNSQAIRKGGEQVFPNEGMAYKYYMEQVARQDVAGPKVQQVASNMQLEWTGALEDTSRIRQEFTAEFLEPYNDFEGCSEYDSCLGCMTNTACGWCPTSSICVLKVDVTGGAHVCGLVANASYLVTQAPDCPVCADHISCETCTGDTLCEWLSHEARCLRRGRFDEAVRNKTSCPVSCRDRSSCTTCLSERNECAWCEQTRTCFPFVEYTMTYAYGGCTQWVDSMSEQQCHNCSRHTQCSSCMSEFQCGWCGNDDNPTIGRCLHGDFTGPDGGRNCSALVSEVVNVSASEPGSWSYGICPDVEECRLQLHDCHQDASCTNTFESYECTCNRGFTGNGKDICNKTCYYDCIHGNCSGSPDYTCLCDIGWMGPECNTNCGCHNHSTCVTGVGNCDECQHWTTGEHCEFCKPGAYGDATTESGCVPCECNGHGDESDGYCNSTDGKCYCRDYTDGDHCQSCIDGYYGDPRRGRKCYLKCDGRTILGNITSGALGSHAGDGVKNTAHAYCLWILTIHSDLNNLRLLDHIPTITFSMEVDIKTFCSRDYVYVYDGIPSFMTSSSSSSATLLAAYCGYNYNEPLKVEAKSGYLTVYFEGNIEPSSSSTRGFNATYHVNSCPDGCTGNRVCEETRCICAPGYGGIDCDLELCPQNCSQPFDQGICDLDLGQCVCSNGFGGPACDIVLSDRVGVYSTVYDPWRVDGYLAFNSSLSRMGHTLVSCGGRALYMFGGYSLSHGILNDIWEYNLDTRRWTQLSPQTKEQPTPRYFHAAVCVPTTRAMYVFGGLVEKVGAVKEMWKFSIDHKRWHLLATDTNDLAIPAMAGHTMTLVDPTKIYVIGGFSAAHYFSNLAYEYDASNNQWREVELSGSQPTGLYGHTAVYHSSSNAIYVFGGYEYHTDKTVITNSLYAIDLETQTWSLLPPETGNKPSARAFHAAVTTKNYMVVLEGRVLHDDFDATAFAYRYSCNHWTDVTSVKLVLGETIPAVIGPAAIAASSDQFDYIYFMGGFNSLSHGSLLMLTLPNDLCTLQQTEQTCVAQLGCAACVGTDTNITYCYNNDDALRFDCARGTSWRSTFGTVCDLLRIETRDCNQHKSCTECLAVWPTHKDHKRVCQWCSNCPTGKCIPKDKNCQRENSCERQQRSITQPKDCVERLCQASDCDKCEQLGSCIWTRQFKRSSEVGRTLSLIPIYDWNCVVKSLLDATPYEVQSSPPNMCPLRCTQYTSCKTCLKAVGSEGGSQECVWSVPMHECMPPAYLALRCSNGECGLILAGKEEHDQCPQNCSIHLQCSHCLSAPGCGWCAYGGLNGLGVCKEGGLTGPHFGACTQPEKVNNTTIQATSPPTWSFGQCMPENECLNGHHNCDESENCTDLAQGFRCDCKVGYARDKSGKCRPDCKQQCQPNGDCVAPDVCQCHFGYVGHNCSTLCDCNQHSNCKSVSERHECIECKNNTKGKQCEECKPLFVGDPKNGGQCKSCTEFCNQHSNFCLSQDQYTLVISLGNVPKSSNLSTMMERGPKLDENPICINCQNNTEGQHCEECRNGYFRLTNKLTQGCQKCECHGHSDICDKESGINCDCKNNTKSPRCEDNDVDSEKKCYMLQCSECVDSFLGKPTDNHQCYRQMTVDRDYCLDPSTQMNCNMEPAPLYWGRTVFFAVQPKYLNVDIRITLDITRGGVDLFFSPFLDTYQIKLDPTTGIHSVEIDDKYLYAPGGQQNLRVTREVGELPPPSSFSSSSEDSTANTNTTDTRGHRSLVPNNNSDTSEIQKIYTFEDITAKNFHTFIKLMHRDVFLRVRNIHHRLVITLPQGVHELKVSRFYLVLLGIGGPNSNETYGNLFFRQDQPHIDLFVFFSVFFSCFFLFLAKCVFLWKIKQAVDAQRSMQRVRMEMQHLASRPFSKASIIVDPYDSSEVVNVMQVAQCTTSTPLPRKSTLPKLYSKYSITSDSFDCSIVDREFTVKPLALEPTDDGVAAVATFFIQLPGSSNTPVHACLGSCLVQSSRVLYSNTHHHQSKSVYIRRQPSSSA